MLDVQTNVVFESTSFAVPDGQKDLSVGCSENVGGASPSLQQGRDYQSDHHLALIPP